MSNHLITIKKQGKKWGIFDHGNICGNRLYRGEDAKKRVFWPFSDREDWMWHTKESEAKTAADKLRTYLEKVKRRSLAKMVPVSIFNMRKGQTIYRGQVAPFEVLCEASRIMQLDGGAPGWEATVKHAGKTFRITSYDDPSKAAESRKVDGSLSAENFWRYE